MVHRLLIGLLIVVFANPGGMAQTYYWVGGTGDWGSASHWSLTSGGPGGAGVPNPGINAVFDANSFTADNQEVRFEGVPIIQCNDMDWRLITRPVTLSGAKPIEISGNLWFRDVTWMNFTFTGQTIFSASNKNVVVCTAGQAIPTGVTFDGDNGHWDLCDDFYVLGDIALNKGHLKTNNHSITGYRFNSAPVNPLNVRSLDLGSSLVTIRSMDKDVTKISSRFTNFNGTMRVFGSGTSKLLFTGEITETDNLCTMDAADSLHFDNVEFMKNGKLIAKHDTFNFALFRANGTLHVDTTIFDSVEIYQLGKAYSNKSTYNRFLFSTHPSSCGCSDCRNVDYGLLQGNENVVNDRVHFHRNGTIRGNANFADSCRFEANGYLLAGSNAFNTLMMRRIYMYGCGCPVYAKDTLTMEKAQVQTINDTVILFGDIHCEHPRITSTDNAVQATMATGRPQYFDYIEVKGINAAILVPPPAPDTAKRSIDLGNNTNWLFTHNFVPLADSLTEVVDVSPCSYDQNGSVTLWASGGEKPYTYWMYHPGWGGCSGGYVANTPPGNNVFAGLATGSYQFKITDAYGCESVVVNATVGGPPPIVIDSVKVIPIPCYHVPPYDSGQIIIYAHGGTGPLSYSIDNGASYHSSNHFQNLGILPGNQFYIIKVHDAAQPHECYSDTVRVRMTQNPKLYLVTETPVFVECFGDSTGVISMETWGGEAPYYVYIAPQDPPTPVHPQNPIYDTLQAQNQGNPVQYMLYAGVYTVRVTDVHGCQIAQNSVNIFENPEIRYDSLITITPGPPVSYCINLTGKGGVPPYTYLWFNGSTSTTVCGLVPGIYCCTITDALGCGKEVCIEIVPLSLTTNHNDVCFAQDSGWACVETHGGCPDFAKSWYRLPDDVNVISTNACIANVEAGEYMVRVVDGCGDTKYDTVVIGQNPQITATFTIDTVSCGGGNDGSLTVLPGGGSPWEDPPGYLFQWSTGSTNATITGLAAGSYSVTVTDSIGCPQAFTVVMPQPPPIAISFITFSNCSTWSAQAVATGGNPQYTYLWSGGQTTNPATGLIAGTYTVTVTDSKSCSKVATVTVADLAVSTTSTQVTCYGSCNGTAVATASGGSRPYTITWRDAGNNVVTPSSVTSVSATISNLCPGDYTVTVADSNNCSVMATVTITQPANALGIVSLNYTAMLACYGLCNGTAQVFATGGTAPYSYRWENVATPGHMIGSTQTISNLCAGTYCVTVTDFNNCQVSDCFTIDQPEQILFNHITTDILCFTDGDAGAIQITNATGGTPPYVYTIHCPGGPFVSSPLFTGLPPGTYQLGIMDSQGCKSACTATTILRPPDIAISPSPVVHPSGFGLCNGSITATASGGTPPYTHNWYQSGIPGVLKSESGITSTVSNLCVGTFCDTVVDANNCRKGICVTLVEPTEMILTDTVSHISCFGLQDGWISVSVSGGVLPYTFEWLAPISRTVTGVTTDLVQGLAAGNYSFIVRDANLNSVSRTFTIVEPDPVIVNFATNVVCFGLDTGRITAIPSMGTPGYTHHWETGAITATITGLQANAWYTDTVYDARGCKTYDSVFLAGNPQMFVEINNYDTTVCKGETIQIDANAYGGTFPYQYNWSPATGVSDPLVLQPSIIPSLPETYILTMTDIKGCQVIDSISFSIDSVPQAAFTYDNLCQGWEVHFTDQSSGNGTTITDYLWDFGDGYLSTEQNPVHTFAMPGTYHVSLTITNYPGCSDYAMDTVYTNPVIQVDFSADTVCLGDETHFTGYSLNPSTFIDYGHWYFDDLGPFVVDPWVPFTDYGFAFAGLHSVRLELFDTTGCSEGITKPVMVKTIPQADFTFTWGCTSDTVKFSGVSTGAGGAAFWAWDFGDPASGAANYAYIQNPSHVYNAPGFYHVTLTVTALNSCEGTVTKHFYYEKSPHAGFSWVSPCFGGPTQFTDQSYSTSGNLVMWRWDFGDPVTGPLNYSNIQNPTHTYSAPGTYLVKLKVFDGDLCYDSVIRQITIHGTPVAAFTVDESCVGEVTAFHDNSVSPSAMLDHWHWDFGDGNSLNYTVFTDPVQHLYSLPGQYTVVLTVTDTNGCSRSFNRSVSVFPLPSAMFQSNPACSGQITYFTDYSNGSGSPLVAWHWDFGDFTTPSTLQNPSHVYGAPGLYHVTLCVTNSNGCVNCYTQDLSVFPSPVADFSADTVCEGSPTHFENLSSCQGDLITSWQWDFGDGTPSSNVQWPIHTFTTSGTYNVSLVVTTQHGCVADTVIPVMVHEPPLAGFTWSQPGGSGCFDPAGPVQFTDHSAITGGNLLSSWLWDFGDGTYATDQNPQHLYSGPGTYFVTLTVFDINGCQHDTLHEVVLADKPMASFSHSVTLCDSACFTDASIGNGLPVVSWHWDFGDPASGVLNVSTEQNPCHEYLTPVTQTYQVRLVATNAAGCRDTVFLPVTVSKPVPDFATLGPSCLGAATEFDDLSVSAGNFIASWNWDFGDPASGSNSSTLENPVHVYTSVGTKYVTLTVTNGNGCSAMTGKPIEVHYPPDAAWSADQPNCFPDATQFRDQSVAQGSLPVVAWEWDFGDGSPHSSEQNPLHTFTLAGTYPVTLTVTNSSGCSHYVTLPYHYYTGPAAAFASSPVSKCPMEIIQFQDQSVAAFGNISAWDWDFGDGSPHSAVQHPTHVYAAPGTFAVTLTVTDSRGCQASVSQDILVNTLPTVDFAADTACVGNITQFTTPAGGTGFAWLWNFGEPSSGVFNASTLQNPGHQYASPGDYFVSLTVTDANGCRNDTVKKITVVPLPLVNFSYTTPCSGESVSFSDETIIYQGSVTGWTWNFGDGTGDFTGQDQVHTFANPGFYTVTLTVVTTGNCPPAFVSKQVEVRPSPQAAFAVASSCAGPVQFTDMTNQNGGGDLVTWDWNFGDPASGMNNVSQLQHPIHIYAIPGNYDVSLIVVNTHGCKDTLTSNITVHPLPGVDFTAGTSCATDTTCFTVNTTVTNPGAIAIYAWDLNGDGSVDSFLRDPCYVYPTPGIVQVTLTVTDTAGCVNSMTHLVQVRSLPVADFTTSGSLCSGDTVSFTDFSVNASGYISRWVWDFGDGSPLQTILFPGPGHTEHLYGGAGPYLARLTVTGSQGCEHSDEQLIQLDPAPLALFTHTVPCSGEAVQFTDLSAPNGGGTIVARSWNFGDPGSYANNTSSLQNPEHLFSSQGTFQVTLSVTSSNGCRKDTVIAVTVKPLPGVEYTWNGACADQPVQFTTDPAVTNIPVITDYLWTFGEGGFSTEQNPVYFYPVAGDYIVTLTVTDTSGCSNHVSHTVTVEPAPAAYFSTSGNTCSNDSVSFHDLSTTVYGYLQEWTWDFGDGSPMFSIAFPDNPDVKKMYASPGTYAVSLTVTNSHGCSHLFTQEVTVIPAPVANFHYSDTCQNEVVHFTDASYPNGMGDIVSWSWDFGDPGSGVNNHSTLEDPAHIYSAGDSVYTVRLIIVNFNNCTDTMVKRIYIRKEPLVDFTFSPTCLNKLVHFTTDPVLMPPASIANWDWDFGDGTLHSTDPGLTSHLYQAPGTYQVVLSVTDTAGCGNSFARTVEIVPPPMPEFTYDQVPCDSIPVQFTDLSEMPSGYPGYISSWRWNWGDGTTSAINHPGIPNLSHLFPTGGNSYTVWLVTESNFGCRDSVSHTVSLLPRPEAAFEVMPGTPSCELQPVQFRDLSQPGNGGPLVARSWDFGDPASGTANTSTVPNPVHLFTASGSFVVTLVVTNASGCRDTLRLPVLISTGPDALFSATAINCEADTVFFTNSSVTPAGTTLITYAWEFGDGSISGLASPWHIYPNPGTYMVKLKVINSGGCGDSVTHQVTVRPKPVAGFSVPGMRCTGSPVAFTDQSFIPPGHPAILTGWQWDFGDGNTSTLQNPVHTYTGSTTSFTVRLTVTSSDGCTGFFETTVTLHSSPVADFEIPSAQCNGQPVLFHDLSQPNGGSAIQAWAWNFGDPLSGVSNTSSLASPQHTFTGTGPYYITLVVTNANGCRDTLLPFPAVSLDASPSAQFSSSATGCDTIHFTDASTTPGGTIIASYFWDFGDGGSATLASPVHVYASHGTYQVRLTVVNDNGCRDSVLQTVTVSPKPVANFVYPALRCTGNPIQFTDYSFIPPGYSGTITAWYWEFGDGGTSTAQNPVHTFSGTANSYLVRLTVSSSEGCSGFIEKQVSLISSPAAAFTNSGDLCIGQPLQFTDMTQTNGGGSIQSWSWNFGDPMSGSANTSALQNPVHSFTGPGPFPIRLVVTNINGCRDTLTPFPSLVLSETPVADFTADTVCRDSITSFSAIPLTNVVDYHWDFGDGQTYASPLPSASHLYALPGSYPVKLTVTTNTGCMGDTTVLVVVYGKPTALFTTSGPTCANDSVVFLSLSTAVHGFISQWIWEFGDGSAPTVVTSPGNPDVKHKFPGGGTFNVRLTIVTSDGCRAFKVTPVQISHAPVAGFTFTGSACPGIPVVFTDQTQLNGGSALQAWSWNFGDPASGASNISSVQNPAHTYAFSGTYTVRLVVTNANGCSDSVDNGQTVTVFEKPVAVFSVEPSCMGAPTQFTDASTTSGGSISTWNWNFGDPASGTGNISTLQNPTHTYNQLGTYTVTLQVTNSLGCMQDTSGQVSVSPKPTAMFQSGSSCAGSETQFTDLSVFPGSSVLSWLWDFGDPSSPGNTSTLQNPVHVFSTSGTFQVKLVVTNFAGCADSITLPIIARPAPMARFSYLSKFCPAGDVFFTDESQGVGGAAITEQRWFFEPGAGFVTGPNPVYHFPVTNASYPVTLVVTDNRGCRDTVPDSLVFVKPGWGFTFENNDTCQGFSTSFRTVNLAAGDTLHPVSWNFGDPASSSGNISSLYSPTHLFSGPGDFVVKLKAMNSDGCIDSVYREVHVDAAPAPVFAYTQATCDSVLHFDDLTPSPGTASIAQWQWVWGDGSDTLTIVPPLDGDTVHTYSQPGIYPVSLIVTNVHGCTTVLTQSVQRLPCISAGFAYQDTMRCARYRIAFADTSEPVERIRSWKWLWGDSQDTTYTQKAGTVFHEYGSAGNYVVHLVVESLVNGVTIRDTMASQVSVRPTPEALFSNPAACLHEVTLFRDTSLVFGEPVTSRRWSFSADPADTSGLAAPKHLYDTAGIYQVSLRVANRYGCADSLIKSTRVYSLPQAAYAVEAACSGNPVSLADRSSPGDTAITSWKWYFGDPVRWYDSAAVSDPVYRFPDAGDFNIRLIVRDFFGCADTTDSTLMVNPSPVAAFTITDTVNTVPGKIRLNNESTQTSDFRWDFGNGKWSETEWSPVVQYAQDGAFDIRLVVTDVKGCADTTWMTYEFMFDNLFVPNAFSPESVVATVKGMEVRKFLPKGLNLRQYHVMVFDKWGHLLWESTKTDCYDGNPNCKGTPVEGWDGTFNGQPMPQDVYIWKINATFENGRVWEGSDNGKGKGTNMGTVTLIR